MAFTTIIPVAKAATGAFKISTVAMRKRSAFQLQISMPSAQFTQYFGAAETLTIQIGDGADAGKMMITADEGGGFQTDHAEMVGDHPLRCARFRAAVRDGDGKAGDQAACQRWHPHRPAGMGLEQGTPDGHRQGAGAGRPGAEGRC